MRKSSADIFFYTFVWGLLGNKQPETGSGIITMKKGAADVRDACVHYALLWNSPTAHINF